LRDLIACRHAASLEPIDEQLRIALAAGQRLKEGQQGLLVLRKLLQLLRGDHSRIEAQTGIDHNPIAVADDIHGRGDSLQGHGHRQRRHVWDKANILFVHSEVGSCHGQLVLSGGKVEGKNAERVALGCLNHFGSPDHHHIDSGHCRP